MTQEDKELLFKDLCARLPYGVKVEHLLHSPNNPSDLFAIDVDKQILYCDHKGRKECYYFEFVKPYLRSMSSMTEVEKKRYDDILTKMYYHEKSTLGDISDYLNSIHVDYRGLIPKGLAIAVTEENSPYK